jgi:hypothetical protein
MGKANRTTGLFRSLPLDQAEDSKLHDLYRSRAALKKKFAAADLENRRLRQIVKKQQGSTALVEQKLEHLETLLRDPQWVHNLVVFYQLRGLNARCCDKLETFAAQLKLRNDKRRRAQVLGKWQARRSAKFKHIAAALARQRNEMKAIESQVNAERANIESMNRFSKLLKGRQSTGALDTLEEQFAAAREREAELVCKLEQVKGLQPPEVPGVETGAKRSINFMILAFAQDLLLRFSDRNFAAMVREASAAPPGEIQYGSPGDCARLLQQLAEETARIEKLSDSAAVLKERATRIAEHADFASPDDAIPAAGTVAAVFAFDSNANVETTDWDLLGQDYWGLSGVTVR